MEVQNLQTSCLTVKVLFHGILTSLEVAIPIKLQVWRMILRHFRPQHTSQMTCCWVRATWDKEKRRPWTGLGRNLDMVPPGDRVCFSEEAALEFSVTWKLGEDF